MKKIILFSILIIFAFGGFELLSEYLDVGNDPNKIQVINIREIQIPSGYRFHSWSPNGDFFSMRADYYYKKIYKTLILKKNCKI